MNQFDALFNDYLRVDNEYFTTIMSVVLVMYAGYAAPQLPPVMMELLDNVIVKLFVFFGLALISNRNPTVALISAVAILATLQAIEKYNVLKTLTGLMSNDEQTTNIVVNNIQESKPMNVDVTNKIGANLLALEEERNDIELDSQPEMVITDGMNPDYRNKFYPQYVDALPVEQTYETRNIGCEKFDDNEVKYAMA
jgi:hypothetical protein